MAKSDRGHFPQNGIVTKVDLQNQMAAVYLPLLDMETDFIRIASDYVGAGWGQTSKLKIKDEVIVTFLGGDLNQGIITKRLFSPEADRPPKESTEDFTLVHENGSRLIFRTDGSVILVSTQNMTINAGGAMTIQSGGAMKIKGATINLN